jgi:hypothetical protein
LPATGKVSFSYIIALRLQFITVFKSGTSGIKKQEKPGKGYLLGGSIMGDWVGGDLLCHEVTRAVPLELRSLTTVFGMGTGVAFPITHRTQKTKISGNRDPRRGLV